MKRHYSIRLDDEQVARIDRAKTASSSRDDFIEMAIEHELLRPPPTRQVARRHTPTCKCAICRPPKKEKA